MKAFAKHVNDSCIINKSIHILFFVASKFIYAGHPEVTQQWPTDGR